MSTPIQLRHRMICGVPITPRSHYKMHFDEIPAFRLAEMFATPDWLKRYCPDGLLRLGVDGGDFDEHAKHDTPAKKTDCCFTLVAKSLGVDQRPEIQGLCRFIFNADGRGKAQPFDPYNGVKQLNELHPNEPERVITWANTALDALIARERLIADGQTLPVSGREMNFSQIFALWLIKKFGTLEWLLSAPHAARVVISNSVGLHEQPTAESDASNHYATVIAISLGVDQSPELHQMLQFAARLNHDHFDLSTIVDALNAYYHDDQAAVISWTNEILEAKYFDQLDFVASQVEVRSASTRRVTVKNSRGQEYFFLVIESDKRSILKAAIAEYKGTVAGVVQRKSNGHTQVFTSAKVRIILADAVRLLRKEERKAWGLKQEMPNHQLRSEGFAWGPDHRGKLGDIWYYNTRGQQLLNGSLTAPDVLPSKLELMHVASLVKIGVENWWQATARLAKRAAASKSAPSATVTVKDEAVPAPEQSTATAE